MRERGTYKGSLIKQSRIPRSKVRRKQILNLASVFPVKVYFRTANTLSSHNNTHPCFGSKVAPKKACHKVQFTTAASMPSMPMKPITHWDYATWRQSKPVIPRDLLSSPLLILSAADVDISRSGQLSVTLRTSDLAQGRCPCYSWSTALPRSYRFLKHRLPGGHTPGDLWHHYGISGGNHRAGGLRTAG